MVATSMSELNSMLMDRLRSAMDAASEEMYADTKEEVSKFYSQGSPKRYRRTGALGNTPKKTPVSGGGKQLSFEIYLDDSGGYSTGTFSMGQVLSHAEAHTAGILGKPHFWADSKKKMGKTFDKTMGRFFH